MPSGSRITFREAAEADIPTPDTGQVSLFVDSADSAPKYRDDGGTVHTLQGADGALTYQNHGNTGASEDVSFATNVHRLVFNAATVAVTFSSYPSSGTPGIIRLIVVQDGTGSRVADWSGISGVTWGAAGEPTLQTAAGAIDIIDFQTYDGGTTVIGSYEVGGYSAGGTDVALADGGTGASLTDPNADRIMFWDDSAGQVTWLTAGTNLTITGTTIDASGGGGATVANVDAVLGSDVTIVNANTFYDGPSGSFAAGTWLIAWKIVLSPIVSTGQSYEWTAKLWDGTTVHDETGLTANEGSGNVSGEQYFLSGCAIVTLGSTTTLKVSAACNRGSSGSKICKEVPINSATSSKVSRIAAYKVT